MYIFTLSSIILFLFNHIVTQLHDYPYSAVEVTKQSDQLSTEDKWKLRKFLLKSLNENDLDMAIVNGVASYCQSLRTCNECVKSIWYQCKWCHNYGCTHKADILCPYAAYSFDKPKYNEYDFCPNIKYQGQMLIHAATKTYLRIKLHAVDPVIYEKEIICQLRLSDKLIHVKGLILNDMVYCYPITIEQKEVCERETGVFRLIWGGVDPFSNDIPVIVYRCEPKASNCETSRLFPTEYQCRWCDAMNCWVISDKCVDDFMKCTLSKSTCQHDGNFHYSNPVQNNID